MCTCTSAALVSTHEGHGWNRGRSILRDVKGHRASVAILTVMRSLDKGLCRRKPTALPAAEDTSNNASVLRSVALYDESASLTCRVVLRPNITVQCPPLRTLSRASRCAGSSMASRSIASQSSPSDDSAGAAAAAAAVASSASLAAAAAASCSALSRRSSSSCEAQVRRYLIWISVQVKGAEAMQIGDFRQTGMRCKHSGAAGTQPSDASTNHVGSPTLACCCAAATASVSACLAASASAAAPASPEGCFFGPLFLDAYTTFFLTGSFSSPAPHRYNK